MSRGGLRSSAGVGLPQNHKPRQPAGRRMSGNGLPGTRSSRMAFSFRQPRREGSMAATAQGTGWQVAQIDEIPPVKPDWPATWKSVRHFFGIEGFGINAVTKDAGNVL